MPFSPALWTVEKTTLEGFVLVAEARPAISDRVGIVGDAGRIVANPDVAAGPLSLALLDVPNVLGLPAAAPTILLAASSATSGWKPRAVELSFGSQRIVAETARRKSVLGEALTALDAGTTELFDEQNSVDVQLIDTDLWLTSCDDEALAGGANLAVLGSEVIQFGRVTALGEGMFRLSRLLRGRAGSEWACVSHGPGDVFCQIDASSVQPVALPSWSIGAIVSAVADGANASSEFGGEALRPPAPVSLSAIQANGELVIEWIRRSRQGFAWIDGVDAPLGEAREQYQVVITGTQNAIELTTGEARRIVEAAAISTLGSGPATIQIQQIGDLAASRTAQLIVDLP